MTLASRLVDCQLGDVKVREIKAGPEKEVIYRATVAKVHDDNQ